MQYLIVYTSNTDILRGDDLVTNGAGLKVSHHFGFGAIDAEALFDTPDQGQISNDSAASESVSDE